MRVGRAAQAGYPFGAATSSLSSAPCVGTATTLGRRRASSWLRTALLLFCVTFVWLQLHVANIGGGGAGGANTRQDAAEVNESAAILSMVPQVLHKYLVVKPRFHNHSATAGSGNSSDALSASGSSYVGAIPPLLDIAEIKRQIERYNEQQTVLNEDLFGQLTNSSLVIVIQVHTRVIYLRHLIVSLAQAKDIDRALLIFSHDYYDEEINELVQSVDFCKVMQIFYPFSIQTHPDKFPGESANDCPRDMKREQALIKKCINAEHPDLYGHYREAKFTQTKHHWWWKANRVFNELEVTRNYTGLVLFLEEDHFVAEDFIHVLRIMQKTCQVSCSQCNILSLGTYLKTYNYYGGDARKKDVLRVLKRAQPASAASAASITPSWNFQILPSLFQHYQKADVTPWISSKHNMGMAFNRTVWRQIRTCSSHFCKYDDYNWDWSLQHVSYNCLPQKLYAMVMKGPRIFHIGECGVHHKKSNCESTAVISKVQKVLLSASRHLYPSHLTLTLATNPKKTKLRKGNGGWGDIRDHNLCLSISNSSVR